MLRAIIPSTYTSEIDARHVEQCMYGFYFDGENYWVMQYHLKCLKQFAEIFSEPQYPAPILEVHEYDWKKRRS